MITEKANNMNVVFLCANEKKSIDLESRAAVQYNASSVHTCMAGISTQTQTEKVILL